MGKRSPDYFRRKAKENYQVDKKLREVYHTIESKPGETYSEFKKRKKSRLF